MNKDFQKILILGIVSIIISALALYSFKDVKFKNTKKMSEQTKKEQELIQEYENLVSNPNDIFTTNYDEGLSTTGNVVVMIPEFLFTTGFTAIEEGLKKKEISINWKVEKDLLKYKKELNKLLNNDADIYLLPSTWVKGLNLENVSIEENPKVYFHQVFDDIIELDENKFIAFAIDPAIVMKKGDVNTDMKRESLLNYTTLREKGRTNSMPIIRGIGKNDLTLLERGEEAFENYFDMLYLHIKQIKEGKLLSELKNMINLENMSLEYMYDFLKFKQLYQTIGKKDIHCELFPSTCLMAYNFGDMKFGYLSDFDILDKYFSNKNQFEIDSFSNSKTSYPVRGWVFVVPKGNEKILLANEFFKEYLRQGVSGKIGLWNNTLSAINDIYNTQIENNKYSKVLENESNFELIYESINLQDEFLKDKKHLDVLKGNYNPDLYVNH